ncbi:hypothetical protein AGMMS49579_00510 [Spirochaetia bacterium]|nr:hypothetical protein AGMMS49579_00380 [Spirochaetia bacterium]GHV49303.1 hypothetical protein AGMMS49579_00510 [Spirochaetia bacterium]
MEKTGLLARIVLSADYINLGRKGLAAAGEANEGREIFTKGLLSALETFKEVQSDLDLETLIQLERTFLAEELRHCGSDEAETVASISQAISYFDDALLSLEAVQDAAVYQGAEKTHPHHPKYRIHGMPKDAFHIACISHRTRLKNILRMPGINPIERALYELRAVNMAAAQNAYLEKQKIIRN